MSKFDDGIVDNLDNQESVTDLILKALEKAALIIARHEARIKFLEESLKNKKD